MTATVRPAGTDDLGAAVAMGAAFYATTSYAKIAPYCEDSAALIGRMLMEHGVLLVAESDRRIVGMVGMVLAPFLFNREVVTAHEVMWWVDPDDRESGAGVALLRAIIPACRERGARAIQMMRMIDSPPQADVLYRRLGFEPSECSYTLVT